MYRLPRKLSIADLDVADKRILMRVDFNVPLSGGDVVDDSRILAALPSIRFVLERQGRLLLASHLGRPRGERRRDLSLAPVAERLASRLGRPVDFASSCIGEEVEAAASRLEPGQVLMLENLRFHSGEKDNDVDFAGGLASLADLYVNDAFGTAHRAHASTAGVPTIMGGGAAGFLMAKEIKYLYGVLNDPEEPVVTILGGAKVSDKIGVIRSLLPLTSTFLIGGGMAYTFLRAQGIECGKSLVEEDKVGVAGELLEEAREAGIDVLLPVDHVVGSSLGPDIEVEPCPTQSVPHQKMALDIGPKTVERFKQGVEKARTIIWNGPMGVFEMKSCASGTMEIARAVAAADAISIVGGGDSAAAVQLAGVGHSITHVSTGGGASLTLLSGKPLPGVEALTDRVDKQEPRGVRLPLPPRGSTKGV